MEEKTCCKCQKTKGLCEFSKNRRIPDGYSRMCKQCVNSYYANKKSYYSSKSRSRYHENREKIRSSINQRRKLSPLGFLLQSAKCRAKKKGVPFDLQESDLHIPDTCPVLGIPIFIGSGRHTWNSPSLDRKDNSLGYVPGNVRVISYRANSLKGSATLEEYRKLVEFYLNLLEEYGSEDL